MVLLIDYVPKRKSDYQFEIFQNINWDYLFETENEGDLFSNTI